MKDDGDGLEIYGPYEQRDLPKQKLDFAQVIWFQIGRCAYYASMDYQGKGRMMKIILSGGPGGGTVQEKWVDDPRAAFYNSVLVFAGMVLDKEDGKDKWIRDLLKLDHLEFKRVYTYFVELTRLAKKKLDPQVQNVTEVIG